MIVTLNITNGLQVLGRSIQSQQRAEDPKYCFTNVDIALGCCSQMLEMIMVKKYLRKFKKKITTFKFIGEHARFNP